MAKEFNRRRRIAQELQKKVAIIIQNDINDPRLKEIIITVSSVELSRDYSCAKIFVTFFKNTKIIIKDKIKILQKSSQYIQYLLSKKIYLRIIPKLTFLYDQSLIEGIRISNIISIATKN